MKQVLALCGSSREGSVCLKIIEAMGGLLTSDLVVAEDLSLLPIFTPNKTPNEVVERLRALIIESDAVLIVAPEYIHALPASIKNVFEWYVGSLEFHAKPVAFITPYTRSTYAIDQALEILKTMEATIYDFSGALGLSNQLETVDSILANNNLLEKLKAISDWLESASSKKENS